MSDTPSSYHHGNLREALMAAALSELSQSSIEHLSLRALAREVGVSQGAPYRHFTDKDHLLAELATQGFDELTHATRVARDQQQSVPQQLRASGRAYIDFALANPEKYRLMFGRGLTERQRFPELVTSGQRAFAVVSQLVNEGSRQQQGHNHSELLAFNLWASIHGLCLLLIDNHCACHSDMDQNAFIEANLDLFGRRLFADIHSA